MYKPLRTLALLSTLPVLSAAVAHADTLTDTITSTNTPFGVIVLTLPASPVPDSFTAGSFTLNSVNTVVDGEKSTQSIVFNDALAGGGGSGAGFALSGDTLFTGSTSMPTFKLGTFNEGGYSLDITQQSVSPVPEPSALLLLGTGLVGLCGVVKRRLQSA